MGPMKVLWVPWKFMGPIKILGRKSFEKTKYIVRSTNVNLEKNFSDCTLY